MLTHEEGVELPPSLFICPYIENPTHLPQVLQLPSSNGYDNVEDNWDDEEVGWENELVMPEMGNDSEEDSQSEGDGP